MRPLFALVALLTASSAVAGPNTLLYQGRLVDAAGGPLSGEYDLSFSVWDSPVNGGEGWAEQHEDVPVDGGYFSVSLGSVTPLNDAFSTDSAWFEVTVQGVAMQPRQPVAAVPYARDADTIDGIQGADLATADSVTTLDTSFAQLEGAVLTLDGVLSSQEAAIGLLEGSVTDLSAGVESLESSLLTVQENLQGVQAAVGTLEAELETTDGSVTDLGQSLDTLSASVGELETSLTELTASVDAGKLPFNPESLVSHSAVLGLCAGMVASSGYGSMRVVRSNGSSCASACDSQDNPSGAPYSNYHCYGSMGVDSASPEPVAANVLASSGWYGNGYCGGTNGMNTFCCCKSNYPNTR